MREIRCKSCKNFTAVGQFCNHCGATIQPQQDHVGTLLDAWGLLKNARDTDEKMRKVALVRVEILKMPGDGSLPNTKDIRVPPGQELFLYTSSNPRACRIPEGEYSIAELAARQGFGSSVQARDAHSWTCFCYVRTRPVSVVFALPDLDVLEQSLESVPDGDEALARCIGRALENGGAKDKDGQVGGITVQVELECRDPQRLMDALVSDYLEEGRALLESQNRIVPNERIQAVRRQVPDPEPRPAGFFASVGRFVGRLFGREEPKRVREVTGRVSEVIHAAPINLRHLYSAIRAEFRSAVKAAVHPLTAAELYKEGNDIRDQVAGDIRHRMTRTLDAYGLALNRVSAFEFICPQYASDRERELQISRAEADIPRREKQAQINEANAEITKGEKLKTVKRDGEITRTTLEVQGETDETRDKLAAQAQARQLAAEGAARQFGRDQSAADSRLDATLEDEREQSKAKRELERREREDALTVNKVDKLKEIELKNQLALLGALAAAFKGQDANTISVLAAAISPQLAPLLAASQQREANERVIALLTEHRDQLTAATAQSSAATTEFNREVAALFAGALGVHREPPPPPQQLAAGAAKAAPPPAPPPIVVTPTVVPPAPPAPAGWSNDPTQPVERAGDAPPDDPTQPLEERRP